MSPNITDVWAQNNNTQNTTLLDQIEELDRTIDTIVPAIDALKLLQKDTSKDMPKYDIVLKATATRWQWEFTTGLYSPGQKNTDNSENPIMYNNKTLVLPKNKTVAFQITSTDIIHPL